MYFFITCKKIDNFIQLTPVRNDDIIRKAVKNSVLNMKIKKVSLNRQLSDTFLRLDIPKIAFSLDFTDILGHL